MYILYAHPSILEDRVLLIGKKSENLSVQLTSTSYFGQVEATVTIKQQGMAMLATTVK